MLRKSEPEVVEYIIGRESIKYLWLECLLYKGNRWRTLECTGLKSELAEKLYLLMQGLWGLVKFIPYENPYTVTGSIKHTGS